jgi:molybdopterin converting factor small subunit
MPSSELTVLLFGPARDSLDGASSIIVENTSFPLSVRELREAIRNQYPRLSFVLLNSVFAVANKLVAKSSEDIFSIQEHTCEIVLIPPVSGG